MMGAQTPPAADPACTALPPLPLRNHRVGTTRKALGGALRIRWLPDARKVHLETWRRTQVAADGGRQRKFCQARPRAAPGGRPRGLRAAGVLTGNPAFRRTWLLRDA